jgi:aryl-alcohol dehydrogenase-like predicted oxidoreductase
VGVTRGYQAGAHADRWRTWRESIGPRTDYSMTESAKSRPFIREALESGINFFDTADMYSLGLHLDAKRC